MGRNKEYRQRLKYQVSSALKKTLENQISVELRQNVGFSLAEAELLSKRLASWLRHQVGFRSPNQILVQGALHRKSFSRGQASKGKMIKVTPFQASDLELELEFGLKVFSVTIIVRVLLRVFDRITGLNPVQVESSSSSIRLVSNYVRNFHRVSKWFKPPGGSPEFVQG